MSSVVPKKFANLKYIQTVEKKYFKQLLLPFPNDCKRHGLNLGKLTDDSLLKFFTSFDTTTSPVLLDLMHLISDVSDEDGADRLREMSLAQGHDLTDGRADIDVREMAIRAYLHDKDLVYRVHDRIGYRKVNNFSEFIGREPRTIKVPGRTQIGKIEDRLAEFFHGKDRGRFCEIRAYAESNAVHFLVVHGKRYTKESVRDDNFRRSTLPFRPEKHDLVSYDNRSGRLKINGQYYFVEEYRKAFSEVLFKDAAWFDRTDVFDLKPLQVRGAAALDYTGIPGVQWVHLAQVKMLVGADGHGTFKLDLQASSGQDDLFKILKSHPAADLKHGSIVFAKLLVKFEKTRGGARSFDITPPNKARYNRWTHTDAVTEFLERNGLVTAPLAPAPRTTPTQRAMATR